MDLSWIIIPILILSQGSDDFRTREAATATLVMMDRPVLLYKDIGLKHPDIEIVRRTQFVIEGIKNKRFAGIVPPHWIDMLPANFPDRLVVIDKFLGIARGSGLGFDGTDWPEYRLATQLLFEEMYDRGECFKQLHAEMRKIEAEYRRTRGMAPLP